MFLEKVRKLESLISKLNSDVILYSGDINRDGYRKFCGQIPESRKEKLLLILTTLGGDPNAGYRIARAAAHYYANENFSILIPDHCKSAGTLLCIGANTLYMHDQSELGPLDVQIYRGDEMLRQRSGLDITRGMAHIENEALRVCTRYMSVLSREAALSTSVASDIASKLTSGIFAPVFSQIDPKQLGEMSAAVEIAREYGDRLNKKSRSLKEGSLDRLITDYPSHGFVIDRAEARELFNRVEHPTEDMKTLCSYYLTNFSSLGGAGSPFVINLDSYCKYIIESNKADSVDEIPQKDTTEEENE